MNGDDVRSHPTTVCALEPVLWILVVDMACRRPTYFRGGLRRMPTHRRDLVRRAYCLVTRPSGLQGPPEPKIPSAGLQSSAAQKPRERVTHMRDNNIGRTATARPRANISESLGRQGAGSAHVRRGAGVSAVDVAAIEKPRASIATAIRPA